MNTNLKLFIFTIALITPVAWGQTFYSPGPNDTNVVGQVAQVTPNNGAITANIFVWDLNDNSFIPGAFDTYLGTAGSKLTITPQSPGGEVFRIVFSGNANISNPFWIRIRLGLAL